MYSKPSFITHTLLVRFLHLYVHYTVIAIQNLIQNLPSLRTSQMKSINQAAGWLCKTNYLEQTQDFNMQQTISENMLQ